ncbi:hypothetical protein FKM82_020153 [Ascaphus truei]
MEYVLNSTGRDNTCYSSHDTYSRIDHIFISSHASQPPCFPAHLCCSRRNCRICGRCWSWRRNRRAEGGEVCMGSRQLRWRPSRLQLLLQGVAILEMIGHAH